MWYFQVADMNVQRSCSARILLDFLWLLKWVSFDVCVNGGWFVWNSSDKPVKYNEVCDSIEPYHKNKFLKPAKLSVTG